MQFDDNQILAQNPWWTDPGWAPKDRSLTLLEQAPMRLPAELVETIDLDRAGVHVLRGPRQVGKTTDLKLLVTRALAEGWNERSIVYLTLDLMEGAAHADLAATIVRAKALAGGPGPGMGGGLAGPSLGGVSAGERAALSGRHMDGEPSSGVVLLDEVTGIARWQTAVKALVDDGTLAWDVVVCTGSSAIDLQRGAAERLPGRRGAGRDHLVLAQTFARFARGVDPGIPVSPGLDIAGVCAQEGREALAQARLHGPALAQALDLYLRFGGLPAAVAEAATGAREPSERVRRIVYDSLLKEVQRRGASVPAAHALLERVLRSLGSTTDWSRMAREMDVPLGRSRGGPSQRMLRDYIELLAGGYFLFILYSWRAGSQTNSLSSEKKVYFADPLLHTIALELVPGSVANVPALVENAIGLTLYRRYEPPQRLIESSISPERLHFWRTRRAGELDFVAGPRNAIDAIEVKYRRRLDRRTAAGAARANPGRPTVIATRDELAFTDTYALIPAHLLLWALG
jgi:predicted AAA+ superfamily ATPase